MAWFQFEAKDRTGALHQDRIEATDRKHAQYLISQRGWFVLRMAEEGEGRNGGAGAASAKSSPLAAWWERLNAARGGARRKYVPAKTEQLAQLLRAGMRLSEVLGIMSKRSSDPAWGAVFDDLRTGVVAGRSLSDSMASHPRLFNSLYRAMVAAGEASGHLVEILERLAEYLQRREAVQQRVVSALIYPCIIIVAGTLTVVFFMIFMLPRLAGMFKEMGQALPWSTQALIATSDFLVGYGWLIPIFLVGGWWGFRQWLKDPSHRLTWDLSTLNWPLVGTLLSLGEFSRFTQTLATLLQSGVTLVEALQVAEATLGNTGLRAATRETRIQVRDGKSLNDALAGQKLFPPLMLDMLAVGERTGDLSGALQHIAQSYERELDRAIRTFTSLIEPTLIFFMAVFVGSIVFSVLMAVFDLTSGIGKI